MDLSYFETVNDEGDISYIRPETKSLADLKRVIDLNKKSNVINLFVDMYIKHQQWSFFEEYQSYLVELEEVKAFNSDLPVVDRDEDGNDIYAEPKTLPELPIRPPLVTVDEFKTQNGNLFRQYNKLNAFEFNGVTCSVCEADQHGWSDLMLANMTKDSLGWAYAPIPFSNENGNKVVLNTREEWDSFYLAAWAARQAFFA